MIARSSFKEKIMPSLSSNIFSATANDCVVSKNEIFGLLFIASVLVFTKNMDKENKIISITMDPTSRLLALLIKRRLLTESFGFDILKYLLKFHLQ